MALIYQHEYAELSVYGHVVTLLSEIGVRQGVHIDLGCGYGAIAEPIKAGLGREYLGFDLADDGLIDLRKRGFCAERVDLLRLDEAEHVIRSAVGDRMIASLSILDTLEHLTNGRDVLAMLRRLSDQSGAHLVISVPNVNHKDIASKSLIGRWDVTESGLLDHTHVDFYNSSLLQKRTAATGWEEISRKDWVLEISDQNFPGRLPVLDVGSPLGGHLRELIENANPDFLVNQFVRAFHPVEPSEVTLFPNRDEANALGLTVVTIVRAAEEDRALTALASLARQKASDFDVLVIDVQQPGTKRTKRLRDALRKLSDRSVKTLAVEGGNDGQALLTGIAHASFSHVAFVPQETELSETWAERLSTAINASPNTVAWLRSNDRPIGRLSPFLDPDQPVSEFALPCIAVRELGLTLKGAKPEAAVETLITQVILACGSNETAGEAGVIDPPKLGLHDPVPDAVLSFLNSRPIIAPIGSAVAIEKAVQAARRADSACAELNEIRGRLAEHDSVAAEAGRRADSACAELKKIRSELAEHDSVAALRFVSIFPQVREFAKPYIDLLNANRSFADTGLERPFLSIVTRTQGSRLSTLCEMLLSLGGQSSTNFESIVVVHSDDPTVAATVKGIVSEFPPSLTERVRVLQCTRPGRAAPLNDALAQARGEYVAFLDDDDFVFGHYVETFEQMAVVSPGKLLRAVCARQDFEHLERGDWPRSRAQSWPATIWPADYDAIDHLSNNYTPFMSVAFPRAIFAELGLRFDEALSTLEDWQFTTRAAALCGVESAPEVTCVYRWWSNASSSLFVHAASDWAKNRDCVISEGSNQPILLPQGARATINAAIDRRDSLEREAEVLRERVRGEAETSAMQKMLWDHRIQIRLAEHLQSSSWRLTRPLRWLGGALTGRRPRLETDQPPMSAEDAWIKLQQIQSSTAWQLSAPIRFIGRIARVPPRLPAAAIEGQAAVEAARQHLTSTSWRITRPLRVLSARMRGSADEGQLADRLISGPEQAVQILHEIRNSLSWKVSAPLRLGGRLMGAVVRTVPQNHMRD